MYKSLYRYVGTQVFWRFKGYQYYVLFSQEASSKIYVEVVNTPLTCSVFYHIPNVLHVGLFYWKLFNIVIVQNALRRYAACVYVNEGCTVFFCLQEFHRCVYWFAYFLVLFVSRNFSRIYLSRTFLDVSICLICVTCIYLNGDCSDVT